MAQDTTRQGSPWEVLPKAMSLPVDGKDYRIRLQDDPDGDDQSLQYLCMYLTDRLRELATGSTGEELCVCQAGLSRRTHTLVFDIHSIDYHRNSDIDWVTRHTMRYLVRSEEGHVVFSPLTRAELVENGIIRWRGDTHAADVLNAWNSIVFDATMDEEPVA